MRCTDSPAAPKKPNRPDRAIASTICSELMPLAMSPAT